jgi:aspartyl-tRNA(Asn)/glutamyl-tRNA(Gln) amidotransferase subunit B
MAYQATIGLEIHAELKTKSKMFCGCKNEPHDNQPNLNTCPVCLAHPGTLPVPNFTAVEHLLKFGRAVNAEQATYTEFDRKSYFYPDIPKAYQISQYKFPFLSGGEIAGVALTRVHLEEDTARNQHSPEGYSLVDFNRAGVPLMELVTEPVIHDAETAVQFAKELQLLLRTLGISDANMEKGEMRVEANISVSQDKTLGTKVEVKNLNSFKVVGQAIAYEIERQTAVLEEGGKLVQETRGWDEQKSRTFSQRSKETAKDYRYFPDPDIPKIDTSKIPAFDKTLLAEKLPKLPNEIRETYKNLGLTSEQIEQILSSKELLQIFSKLAEAEPAKDEKVFKLASNYMLTDLVALADSEGKSLQELNL